MSNPFLVTTVSREALWHLLETRYEACEGATDWLDTQFIWEDQRVCRDYLARCWNECSQGVWMAILLDYLLIPYSVPYAPA